MTDSPHILIIGSGPAGSAAAALLARAGRSVMLVEKDQFPRDKLCGEFLSGEACPLLDRMGCGAAIEAAGPARILRWRFTAPSGRELSGCLPRPALGLSRRTLDQILFRHAASCGAETREGVEVRRLRLDDGHRLTATLKGAGGESEVTPTLAIAAWGRRSSPGLGISRPSKPGPAPYIGVKRHHEFTTNRAGEQTAEALDATVEIHSFHGGYCGLNLVEGQRVNVCMLLERWFVARTGAQPSDWPRLGEILAGANRALASRLEGLTPVAAERPLVIAQPAFGRRKLAPGPLLGLGDAAGMIPPLCGDGQAMAMNAAVDVGEMILAAKEPLTASAAARLRRQWDTAWSRKYGRRVMVGRALQAAMSRPLLAEAGIRALGFMPWAAAGLVRATRG